MSAFAGIERAGIVLLLVLCAGFGTAVAQKADNTAELRAMMQRRDQRIPDIEVEGAEPVAISYKDDKEIDFDKLDLPEDNTVRFAVKEIRISGNTLITTGELLRNIPAVYNSSSGPAVQAPSSALYDLRVLREIVSDVGQEREVSERMMQGLTRYILAVYRRSDYAGVYVYIAAETVDGKAELRDGILPVQIVEARVSNIRVTHYDPSRVKQDKGYLRSSVIRSWSPARPGQVVNRKKLDYFVNLLNLNPDRYVSAVVSKGTEPETLALGYDVYETSPWHYFMQVDDSGNKERRWSPTFGVMNTNLTGRDDRLNVMYQTPLETGDDNYSLFASYDFPLWTPRLRAGFFAGRNEFDIGGGGGIDFIGQGHVFGGQLLYNLYQKNGWFFDVRTSLSRESSKVTPSLFKFLKTDINIDIWTVGANLHRSNEEKTSYLAFDRLQSVGGSSKAAFVNARAGTDPDFSIYILSAAHSQQLGSRKEQQLSGSFRLIVPTERLAPSKMTTFGGMYSVRGYKEEGVVADGGVLFSLQHEFDLIKFNQLVAPRPGEAKKQCLRKLALLSFFDFGRAKTKDSVVGEQGVQELASLGLGVNAELGDNFEASMYYGWPLRSAGDTKAGQGRFNFSFIVRN